MKVLSLIYVILILSSQIFSQDNSVWVPDNGDGTYKNPVIFADYSDPDIVRVGDDFYMTASSFNCVPALPILHSKDLVNWTLINHAVKNFSDEWFDTPQHGNGVWAPSIRYHNGMFYIYWGDPDHGIYMVRSTTSDPAGNWTKPQLVIQAYGYIDPCPLWDDDSTVYLVHAFARSRAGINSLLQVNKLNMAGTSVADSGTIVFDGHNDYPTIEGPKFYKRNGYYYIFAPAGGVTNGWQTVLRSENVYGPYEPKIVLEQGSTEINGPHQDGWVSLDSGEDWFMHFQDKGTYGRLVHLNPVHWVDDWPMMGVDYDSNGIGEPVSSYKKPDVGAAYPAEEPQTSDEFETEDLGLQWQWQANWKEEWYSLTKNPGSLRLYPVFYFPENNNKWLMPNMLLQKFPAPEFSVHTKLTLNFEGNEKAALIIMGTDYAEIQVEKVEGKIKLTQIICNGAQYSSIEKIYDSVMESGNEIILKVNVNNRAHCDFGYSIDGTVFKKLGQTFLAREGKWIGAKVGLLAFTGQDTMSSSYVDVDWFRVQEYSAFDTVATTIDTPIKQNPVRQFHLANAYPNPFNPSTTISYTIPNACRVKLKVYDIKGGEIETLVDDWSEAGTFKIRFNAKNLSSGLYIYKLQAEKYVSMGKMVFIK